MSSKVEDQSIISLQALCPEDKEIARIIKYLRLEPDKYQWRRWSDCCGNYFEAINSEKFKISSKGDLQNYRDLFLHMPLKEILPRSRIFLIGKSSQEEWYLWAFSSDIRIRHWRYCNNVWSKSLPPLIGGLEPLRIVIKNLSAKEIIPISCSVDKEEISMLICPIALLNSPALEDFNKLL